MKFLLTSAGIKNTSIQDALVELLGKPIAESSALCIPTAAYGHPMAGPGAAWRFISGREPRTPMCELGWKSLGVLELTALPSIDEELWVPMVQETDVLLVNGGDPLYLCYWMRQSGLADLLPSLETFWVGLSAGSLVMTPKVGEALRPLETVYALIGVGTGLFSLALPAKTSVRAKRARSGARFQSLRKENRPTKRPQNGGIRSFVENDRLVSFHVAPQQRTLGRSQPDGWDCAGF